MLCNIKKSLADCKAFLFLIKPIDVKEKLIFFIFTKTTQKMKTFFKELFEYSTHFNQKLISVLDEHGVKAPEKCVKLQNHIIQAHEVWNSRLADKKTPASVWEIMPMAELKKLDVENFATTLDVIDARDFAEMINYRNLKGEARSNSVRDILFHVVNHSTYHRGQINGELKQHGIEPLITDYIFHKR